MRVTGAHGGPRPVKLDPVPNLRPQELLIILVIILVLFGGSRLPQLARNLGQAQREFRSGMSEEANRSKDDETEDSV